MDRKDLLVQETGVREKCQLSRHLIKWSLQPREQKDKIYYCTHLSTIKAKFAEDMKRYKI
jgi:hypothetical protein